MRHNARASLNNVEFVTFRYSANIPHVMITPMCVYMCTHPYTSIYMHICIYLGVWEEFWGLGETERLTKWTWPQATSLLWYLCVPGYIILGYTVVETIRKIKSGLWF